jgi:hypothetical protein
MIVIDEICFEEFCMQAKRALYGKKCVPRIF